MILTGHPCAGKTTLALQIRERALRHSSGRIQKVVLINEQSACPDHSIAACYANSLAEKKMRAALKSSFDRAVAANPTDSTLILLDSTNYIKGFRYELFCISKEAATSHCVVWCLNDTATIQEWNKRRRLRENDDESTYSEELLASLIRRYEPPDERNRWDKPLYRIDLRPASIRQQSEIAGEVLNQSVYNMHNLSDAIGSSSLSAVAEVSNEPTATKTVKRAAFKRSNNKLSASTVPKQMAAFVRNGHLTAEALSSLAGESNTEKTELTSTVLSELQPPTSSPATSPTLMTIEEQIDEILNAFLLNVQPLQEGASTRQHVATNANVLHNVDAITQQVCSSIAAAQDKSSTATSKLPVSAPDGTTLFLDYRRRLTAPELQRIRRQYIQWVGTNPPEDVGERGIAQSFLAYINTVQ